MEHIDYKLRQLRENLLTMNQMVKLQVHKSKQALFDNDQELADEVLSDEPRINEMELLINKDCKNILALYTPLAIDLRFILSSHIIVLSLERIGDHAENICQMVKHLNQKIAQDVLETFRLSEMFDKAIRMLNNNFKAIENKSSKLAGKTFKKDKFLNKVNQKAIKKAIKLIHERPEKIEVILNMLDVVRNLERVGDLSKNISEEIIFHIEARELKHASLAETESKKKT